MDKKRLITIIISSLILILIASTLLCLFSYKKGTETKVKIVHVDFNDVDISEDSVWTYKFLNQNVSNYIEDLSAELGLDPDLVVAHLMVENPKFDPEATHKNENGTFDCGLMQLNDRYIYTVFVPAYWDFKDVEFNPFNWKHNLFLSMHHIRYLNETLKVQDDAIAAYNAGKGRVLEGTLPYSTVLYVAAVKNNYKLLKEARSAGL